MKEREIRQRIERVVHLATMSATLGITMSLAACGESAGLYAAQMPVDSYRDSATQSQPPGKDAAADFPLATPVYMALMPDAQMSDTAAPDATIDDSSGDIAD
jgi:predicted small lipoprotein YifL